MTFVLRFYRFGFWFSKLYLHILCGDLRVFPQTPHANMYHLTSFFPVSAILISLPLQIWLISSISLNEMAVTTLSYPWFWILSREWGKWEVKIYIAFFDTVVRSYLPTFQYHVLVTMKVTEAQNTPDGHGACVILWRAVCHYAIGGHMHAHVIPQLCL